MYNFGEGVGLNFAKAAEFYQEALRNFSAAFNLAQLYVDGLGVDQDEVLAGGLLLTRRNTLMKGRVIPWQ